MDQVSKKEIGRILVSYLTIYMNKRDLRMKPVVQDIKIRVLRNRPVSKKQFDSIINFLEREQRFTGCDRNSIYNFFSPLIEGTFFEETPNSTLESFFT